MVKPLAEVLAKVKSMSSTSMAKPLTEVLPKMKSMSREVDGGAPC